LKEEKEEKVDEAVTGVLENIAAIGFIDVSTLDTTPGSTGGVRELINTVNEVDPTLKEEVSEVFGDDV
jgi:hypothetical protein